LNENIENFEKILSYRTKYITVVLEDIYQIHNANSIIRICESFGIQDIHIIENYNQFKFDYDFLLGVSDYMNIIRYNNPRHNNTKKCFDYLKKNDYRVIATSLNENAYNIEEIDISKSKIALVFGTEENGLSQTGKQEADEFVKIPMYGFTQSFNVSVSVGIALSEVMEKLHSSNNVNWELSKIEAQSLKSKWSKF